MKTFLTVVLLAAAYTSGAQMLTYKIPKDASVVASLKGDKLLELISIPEFNKSFLAKKMLEEAAGNDHAGSYNSVEDFGIRLNGTLYYYIKQTDSISYNCVLIPLADANKFEQKFVSKNKGNIVRKGNVRTLHGDRDETLMMWDNDLAYVVMGSVNSSYFEEDTVAGARYGIKRVSYGDYYYDDAEVIAPVAEDLRHGDPNAVEPPVVVENQDNVEDAPVDISSEPIDTIQMVDIPMGDVKMVEAPVVEERPIVEEIVAPVTDYPYNQTGYEVAYQAQYKIKKELALEWSDKFMNASFAKNSPTNSILENPGFLRSQDKDAVATFYMSGMQDLYRNFIPYYSKQYFGNLLSGYGNFNAKLYMNKTEARLATEMEVDDKKAASFKKMYRHKPNKKFAKYINSDKAVGFMSYAFDTEEYLKELPNLMDQTYGRYFGLYQDEIGIGADIFSLLLDEKAVAKVIKGDAILVLSDVGPKEYSYTTYDYDDDYKRTEVTKTKTETLPDFLFMMSSDDAKILERLLNYGIRKNYVNLKNGIYSLDNKIARKNPFSVHVLIKDGIVFCGTSYRDIQQISNGSFQSNMSKEEKELMLKNNFAVYFNPKNMVGKISPGEFGNTRKLNEFNTLLGSTGKVYMKSTGIKNNIISGEMVAAVPENKTNAMSYFLALIEQASRMD